MTDHISVVLTPKGKPLRLLTRPETNDEALAVGILGEDEYHLAELPLLTGWALDIGAHIGTVGLALALDHPDLNVVMVEPVPDNADLIRRSIKNNGLEDRCHVIEAMAGQGTGTATCRYAYTHLEGFEDQGYVTQNAYIGGIWRLTDDEKVESKSLAVPVWSLDMEDPPGGWGDLGWDLLIGADQWCFTKLDCEGCEWDFLANVDTFKLPLMVMEVHDAAPGDIARILPGYRIEVLADYGGSGIVRATAK